MPTESSRCQYIDPDTHLTCDVWYPFSEHPTLCGLHRPADLTKEVHIPHIPKTVSVMNGDSLKKLNDKVAECLQMSIPELAEHIRSIEDRIRELEHDRRAANIAKRNLEDKLTEEERDALREESASYKVREYQPKPKKSPEEKAKNRKEGFSTWAARLGVKVDELYLMDDDEMKARIDKYRAQTASRSENPGL